MTTIIITGRVAVAEPGLVMPEPGLMLQALPVEVRGEQVEMEVTAEAGVQMVPMESIREVQEEGQVTELQTGPAEKVATDSLSSHGFRRLFHRPSRHQLPYRPQ